MDLGIRPRLPELRSGLVDLVVCVSHHGGGGHGRALARERCIRLLAEHAAKVGNGGGELGKSRRGDWH